MHKRERYFAMLNDDRAVHPFEWGLEHVGIRNKGDSLDQLTSFSRSMIGQSDEFFRDSDILDENLDGDRLTWRSAVETPSNENNTVYSRYFAASEGRSSAVVVLPHWNAKAGTYFDLCSLFDRIGISALRLTLPYHEERMPPELDRAEYLVGPNVGRTLQSVRQAVKDTRSAVRWLKNRGYKRVGIVGTSIGSCVAFLSFVHDTSIDAGVFNHVSGYFSDVVWKGLSTYHVRESLETAVTLEQLREIWLPISPLAYIEKLAVQARRPQHYIYTRYDLTFPYDLSLDTMNAFRRHNIPHGETVLPCGHYTLGEKPWNYIDGYKIVSFLRKQLK